MRTEIRKVKIRESTRARQQVDITNLVDGVDLDLGLSLGPWFEGDNSRI
jgi:hypothetical protein